MILRNKKTGEILDITCHKTGDFREKYNSLAELNEDWEDYEPLIKDEKIRKAVRAWAEVNGINSVMYDAKWNKFARYEYVIMFDYDFDLHDGLEDAHFYTIAELCGEEE